MPSYKVAHMREQGQDMIIVPLDPAFGRQTRSEQHGFVVELQQRANEAGLNGRVIPIWPGGFIAPPNWHPFFRTLPLQLVHANLNKVVHW